MEATAAAGVDSPTGWAVKLGAVWAIAGHCWEENQGKSRTRHLLLRELGLSRTNDHVSERLPHHTGKRLRI